MSGVPKWLWPFRREKRPVVAVLTLHGAIGSAAGLRPGLTITTAASRIEAAFAIKGVTAVALSINSPGGAAVQSMLIHKRIRALAEEKGVPVLAFTEDVAASGGYILALAGDEIIVDESSLVGSIGVISASFGFPDLMSKIGVERRVHTAGQRKAMLDPFSPEREEDVARIKSIQSGVHDAFKALVRARRGDKLKGEEAQLFSGDVWVGSEALSLGLVDATGDLRTTLRERYGDKVRLRPIEKRKMWFPFAGWRSETGTARLPSSGNFAFDVVSALELRALWGRFGL